MSAERNAEIAKQLILTMKAHGGPDPGLVTPDFGWWMSFHHSIMNLDEMRQHIKNVALPPLEMEVIGVAAGEDRVAVEVQGRCLLPGGVRYDNNYCFVMVFRDGLVCQVREYCDTKLAADTVGMHASREKPAPQQPA
jgi:ketosteroid isomerase-like protein